jgi:hypothetical protein
MTKEEFLKSKLFKIALPLIAVVLIIAIWRNGYGFGQWLYRILH